MGWAVHLEPEGADARRQLIEAEQAVAVALPCAEEVCWAALARIQPLAHLC